MALPMDVDSWLDGWATMAKEDREYLAQEIADKLGDNWMAVTVALDLIHEERNG